MSAPGSRAALPARWDLDVSCTYFFIYLSCGEEEQGGGSRAFSSTDFEVFKGEVSPRFPLQNILGRRA